MENTLEQPGVILLAAGQSDRMGTPKHLLRFSESQTFIEHIVEVYQRFQVSKIVIVVNEKAQIFPEMFMDPKGIQIVVNNKLEFGRFYSVQLGLQSINGNCFIQNIDNPFVNLGLLINLNTELKGSDYCVPVYNNKGGHPILISEKIAKHIVRKCDKDSYLNDILKSFDRKNVMG